MVIPTDCAEEAAAISRDAFVHSAFAILNYRIVVPGILAAMHLVWIEIRLLIVGGCYAV
jgi:hypothetical protein